MQEKVIVAMSGGVDSSVTAALLKRAGFDVIGIFMKFWNPAESKNKNRCCTPESEKKARQVARVLDIPFYVLNLEKEFKKRIVDYFLKAEKQGITPNPCVVCNKEIKFGLLLDKALKLGADFIATGHYAVNKKGRVFQSKDKNKDQSYFLWKLDQECLSRVLFPIGGYTKPEIRELARKFKLPTAEAKESQEICFISDGINKFLKKYLKTKPGNIVDINGNILGSHFGLWFYTIGQRKGISIASDKPYYVLRKDIKKNELVVTQKEKDLFKKDLSLIDVNWVSAKAPKLPVILTVKVRYRSNGALAEIKKGNKVVFLKPQRAITPGQSAVFYNKKELLGGGVIMW